MGQENAVTLRPNLNIGANIGDWLSPDFIRTIVVGGATIIDKRLALSHKAQCMEKIKKWVERRKRMNHNLTLKSLANGRFTRQEIKWLLEAHISIDQINEAENSIAMEERALRGDEVALLTGKLMSINWLLKKKY